MSQVVLGRFGDRRLEKGGLFACPPGGKWRTAGAGAASGGRPGGRNPSDAVLAQRGGHARVDGGRGGAADERALRGPARAGDPGHDGGAIRGRRGLYLHPTLAVDAAIGAILGLTHAEFLSRTHGKKADRRKKPIAEKQSRRWLDAADHSAEVCATAARLTMIGDRENDIFQACDRRGPTCWCARPRPGA